MFFKFIFLHNKYKTKQKHFFQNKSRCRYTCHLHSEGVVGRPVVHWGWVGTQCVLAGECPSCRHILWRRLRLLVARNYRTARPIVPCLHTSRRACVTLAAESVQVCTTMSNTHEAFTDRESALVFCSQWGFA